MGAKRGHRSLGIHEHAVKKHQGFLDTYFVPWCSAEFQCFASPDIAKINGQGMEPLCLTNRLPETRINDSTKRQAKSWIIWLTKFQQARTNRMCQSSKNSYFDSSLAKTRAEANFSYTNLKECMKTFEVQRPSIGKRYIRRKRTLVSQCRQGCPRNTPLNYNIWNRLKITYFKVTQQPWTTRSTPWWSTPLLIKEAYK